MILIAGHGVAPEHGTRVSGHRLAGGFLPGLAGDTGVIYEKQSL
jgi:hypothetical protein